MARIRDYKAEYARRVALRVARGTPRNYKAEYQRQLARAKAAGFTSVRARKVAVKTAKQTPVAPIGPKAKALAKLDKWRDGYHEKFSRGLDRAPREVIKFIANDWDGYTYDNRMEYEADDGKRDSPSWYRKDE